MGSTQSSNGGRANNYKTPDDKTPSKSKVQNGTKQKVSDNKVDSSVRSKASVAETTESLPPPKPTRRTKRQILKQLDLKTCDDHASRVQSSTVEKLASYLTSELQTDVEKVRAFYYWITHNIMYDTTPNFHSRDIPTDAKSVLTRRKTVCIGYANLFADMCRQVDIPVKVLVGYSKGFGYNPEAGFSTNMETDHAWNAVFLLGGWHFVECTWGAGSRDDNGKFIKRFSDFHFLTPPRHFAASHFPYLDGDLIKSQKWQLLAKPIDIETFSKRVKGTSKMYELGIKTKSHPNSVIDVNKAVGVRIGHPKSDDLILSARLYDKKGKNLDQYVLTKRTGKHEVTIKVNPPAVGDYMLHVFGKTDPDIAELDALVTYVLRCKEADKQVSPYPRHNGLWGPYSDYIESGFHESAGKTVEYKVNKGQLDLRLKTLKPVEAIVKLEHATELMNDNNCFAILHRDRNSLLVSAKFPSKGKYKLSVFTKNTDANTFSPRLCYLIHCDKELSPCIPFPKEFQQTSQFSCRLIEPMTKDIPAESKVRIRFVSRMLAQARVGTDVMKRKGNTWNVTIQTPRAGNVVKVLGSDKKGEECWALYQFDVVK